MAGADAAQTAQEIAGQMLMVPADWFSSPLIVVNLVVPLITTGLALYLILSRKVRIFRNTGVNLVLAYVLAIIAIPFFIVPSPSLVLFMTVFGIITLLGERLTLLRFSIAALAGVAAWALSAYYAYLITLFFG